ncbi:MAG: hypothetical protein K6E97_06360 [Treponema sp.]|nr:hypothetical protein [Treponema sp.]
MAEKKTHTYVAASTGAASTAKPAKPLGNSAIRRVFAIILWLAAIASEVLGILAVGKKIEIGSLSPLVSLIIFLVVDLIFCVIANFLWKKANHISPASKKNPALFWIYNNLGVIMALICFAPIIIYILTNKQADKKTKIIGTVVAVVALLIAGVTGIDFNPISKEELAAANAQLVGQTVYWTKSGKVYHTSDECSHLNRSEELIYGDVNQAVEANKTRICKTCAKRDSINTDGMLVEDTDEE